VPAGSGAATHNCGSQATGHPLHITNTHSCSSKPHHSLGVTSRHPCPYTSRRTLLGAHTLATASSQHPLGHHKHTVMTVARLQYAPGCHQVSPSSRMAPGVWTKEAAATGMGLSWNPGNTQQRRRVTTPIPHIHTLKQGSAKRLMPATGSAQWLVVCRTAAVWSRVPATIPIR
jgi:hypothetical protein